MKTLEIVFWISVFVVFYTYIGYGIVLWVLVKVKETFRPRKEPRMPDELPEVTLFVAAYNEERVVDEKMANTRSLRTEATIRRTGDWRPTRRSRYFFSPNVRGKRRR